MTQAADEPFSGGNDLRPMETIVARVLLIGVCLSSALILIGLLLIIFDHNHSLNGSYKNLSHLRFEHSIGQLLSGLIHLKGIDVISVGLFLLISTPIARVLSALLFFLFERDKLFTLICAFVFVVLILSFVFGSSGF